jgi:D-3-phosphoglycerate dehydrogenase
LSAFFIDNDCICLILRTSNHIKMTHQPIKILHLDSNHPYLWDTLATLGFENHADYSSSKELVMQKIHEFQGIVIRSRFDLDRDFLEKAKNLQFIARVGAGLESIDLDFAAQQNIHLIAAPEGNANAVGEHALGMLINLMQKISEANISVKSGNWLREPHRGFEIEGKTVGIIGYGNMGKSLAKKLQGFDCEVICYDIQPEVGDAFAKQVSMADFCEKADIVSLHTPWTPETNRMIDKNWISNFKKPFWFINTARGKSVVTDDLVEALQSGKILGAGLDVLEYEKNSFETLFEIEKRTATMEYLLTSPKVILSPHIAGWTFESHLKLAQTIVEKIRRFYGV